MSVHPVPPGNEPAEIDAAPAAVSGPSWQLFPNGLLVFERVLGPNGPSRLLVSSLEICDHPECTCREVTLKAVDLELAAPPDSFEEFRRLLDEGENKFFQIDIDPSTRTGSLSSAPTWMESCSTACTNGGPGPRA